MSTMPTAPPGPRRSSGETAQLGDEIYERDIRARVEADHVGEIVAIDVSSGCWAMGGTILEAVDRLRAQSPDAIDVWGLRVGHRSVYSFGGQNTLLSAE